MFVYLGIDGGGTKTKVNIIDLEKNILFENIGGPSSIDTVSYEESYNNIYNLIKPFFDNQEHLIKGVFAGLGGIIFDEEKERVVTNLKNLPFLAKNCKIEVENDMYNALYSGFLFDEGISLISGTGMVAFGIDKFGNKAKCGGWSYKEGEFGSGYHLGMSAVQYLIRAYDGRYEIDDMAREIAKTLNFNKATDIIELTNELHINRTKVASLSPIITKYGNLGHLYALKVIDFATDEILLAIKGVIKQLKLTKKELVMIGGLVNSDTIFREMLLNKLFKSYPDLTIIEQKADPATAAAYKALHNKGERNEKI